MRFSINGLMAQSDAIKLFKASDGIDIPVRIFSSVGVPTDLTTVTTTIECYTSPNRSAVAVKSFAASVVTALAGAAKIAPTVATVNFGPGTYYMFAKTVTAGAVAFSDNYVTLKVG